MTLDADKLFDIGNYTALAFANDRNDWRTYAALGLIGKTTEALEGLCRYDGPDARFYEAVTRWIGGEDEAAARLLEPLRGTHAQNLLALIRKPKIQVLAQLPADRQPPWDLLSAAARDSKFEVRNISFHPQDLRNEPYADIHRFTDSRVPPDFYACLMAEWHLIPPNLQELPCPLLGTTADYDVHIQDVYPWLQIFDEMVVSSQTEWEDVRPLVRGPVSTFPKVAGLGEALPPLSDTPREIDVFLSGTTFHPLQPEKARLLFEVLSMPEAQIHIHNGFADMETYYDLMRQSKVCFTYVRHPGAMPTRGLEALSMGCAVAVQRGCVMSLFAGEAEGVLTYDAEAKELAPAIRRILDDWPEFERRARKGSAIIRREFALPRVASQYLRFLTYLAARPRPPRRPQTQRRLAQKRTTMSRGWLPRVPGVLDKMLVRNMAEWHRLLETSSNVPASVYIDITRELVLDYATKNPDTEEQAAARAQTLQSALNLFRTAMTRHPKSLVLRFNFIRTCLHFGRLEEVQEGLRVAQECLRQPLETWQIRAEENIFPWDFFSEYFNYRAYFDLVTNRLGQGAEVGKEAAQLILAALHFYAAEYAPHEIDLYARAVELDPEFASYRFRYAQALLKRREPADIEAAGEQLLHLAEGSVLWVEALETLKTLHAQGHIAVPNFEVLERAETNAHRSTVVGHEAWQFDDNALAAKDKILHARQSGTTQARIVRSERRPAGHDYLVSALVPIYNAERYMRSLLEDLEAQTIAEQVEIVICDTGSPQNEGLIIEEFQARYDNIVSIRTEHRENQNAAANRCIEAATGKYLALACADDRHRPDAYEVMARALESRSDVGLVYADSLITRTPNETFARNTADRVFRWPEYSLRQLLMHNIFGPQPMWRKSVHAEVGAFNPEYVVAGDYDLFSRIARQYGAAHLAETLGLFLDGGFAIRNQQRGIDDMRHILRQFRTSVTLEEIYPGLAAASDDKEARTAALLDLGNGFLSGNHPDPALAISLYRQAQEQLGEHPVVLNNLGVALCLLGEMDKGAALLERLARAGDEAARHNLSLVTQQANARVSFSIGSLVHSVVSELPPLVSPESTQQKAPIPDLPPDPLPKGKGSIQEDRSPSPAAWERGLGGEGGLEQRAAARNAEGETLFHQGDRQGAFLAFSEAARLDPMFAQAYNNLGAWWYTEGSVEKAIDCFTRALQLDPDDRDAVLNCGQLFVGLQQTEKARQIYQAYLRLHPDDAEVARAAEPLGVSVPAAAIENPKSIIQNRDAVAHKSVSFIIITAGNRPEMLALVLRSIRAQDIPDAEIIVSGRHREEPGLLYIPAEEAADSGRLGEMRNRAVARARYEHIVVLDDDILLAPDWYANFRAYPHDFDILTSQVRLPDGSRYWDHVYRGEGRGEQRLLDDSEDDPRAYMTGGGGWVMKDYVARAVQWDAVRGFYQDEDVDFARRCRAQGYKIAHHACCRVYHADPTYTSIGRWTVRRSEGRTHRWVETELAGLSPLEIYVQGEIRLGRDKTAEGADCFRYGARLYPDVEAFHYGLAAIERKSGGHLPGVAWYAEGDPEYLDVLRTYGEAKSEIAPAAVPCPVYIRPDVSWRDPAQAAQPLSLAGGAEEVYAQEAGPFLLALEAAGGKVALQARKTAGAQVELALAVEARLQPMLRRAPDTNYVQISSLFPTQAVRRSDARLHIGRVGFETDGLPEDWVAACNQMDAVWVPSAFNQETFARAGVEPSKLAVIPSPLLMPLYDPSLSPLPIDGVRGFNFLTILDWKRSQGWATLLRAYVKEFRQSDDVTLIVHFRSSLGYTKAQITQTVIGCVQQALKGNTAKMPTILLHDAEIPAINWPNLYRAADCFVLPAHGEGWGRPYREAMAMGLPVIGTNWGGNTDFMTSQNSYLIRSRLTPVPPDAIKESPLYRGQQWAEPDEFHLRGLMRQVFTRREEARAVGAQARADVGALYGYERVAETMRAEWTRLGVHAEPSLLAEIPLG